MNRPQPKAPTVEAHVVRLPGPRGGKRKREGDQVTGSLVKGAVPPMPADAFVVEVVTDGESEVEEEVLAWCVSAQAADASEGDPIELETGEGGEGDGTGEGGLSEEQLDRIMQEQLARLRSSWS